jgi:hypothetical protein
MKWWAIIKKVKHGRAQDLNSKKSIHIFFRNNGSDFESQTAQSLKSVKKHSAKRKVLIIVIYSFMRARCYNRSLPYIKTGELIGLMKTFFARLNFLQTLIEII